MKATSHLLCGWLFFALKTIKTGREQELFCIILTRESDV